MKKVFEKIIEKLEELKKSETEREDLCDEEGHGDGEEIYEDGKRQGRFEQVVRIIEIVKQEAEKYNNGWIPCDVVHFPEENVYVRVTTWTETEKIGFRRDGKWFVYGSDGLTEATVLAWQPTEPYQSKGE